MFVVMVGLPLAFQSHRILLSHWSTRAELGNYAVAVALYVPAWSLVSAMGINLWPYFSRARELKSENDARLVLYRIGAIFAGLGVVFASVFFLLAPFVTDVWSSVAVPTSLWAGFSLLLLVQTVQLPLGMFLTTPRMLAFQAACVALMAMGTIGLAQFFVGSLGALAPVLSSAVAVFSLQIVPGALYVFFSSSAQLSRRPKAGLSSR
ncbi:hypothetical protein COO55_09315 [Rhodococcus opacus]|nr:hypothetical protein COO55_09315 [Rhodococcus opacus]